MSGNDTPLSYVYVGQPAAPAVASMPAGQVLPTQLVAQPQTYLTYAPPLSVSYPMMMQQPQPLMVIMPSTQPQPQPQPQQQPTFAVVPAPQTRLDRWLPSDSTPSLLSSEEAPTVEAKRPANAVSSQVLRVSGSTRVSGLAGAIANRLRDGESVVAEAMGPAPVACMMRALSHASEFLNVEDLRAVMQVSFMSTETLSPAAAADGTPVVTQHPGLRFAIAAAKDDGSLASSAVAQTLNVRESSVPGKSAGAIAKLARTYVSPRRVFSLCMASDHVSINTGTKALTLARKMLEQDGLDLHLYPKKELSAKCGSGPAELRPLEIIVRAYDVSSPGDIIQGL
eukprot:Rhum_TRINITY_DN13085_c3_g1::Rhum_TRINITY_DN13085_c3_g1_i1::g.56885::m.56885